MEEKIERQEWIESIKSLCLYSSENELEILYTISNHTEKFYVPKIIKKRNGSNRQLYVPKPILKQIQKNILNNVLYAFPVSDYAMAYVKNRSLVENAKPHVNKKIILKLDIEDFFGSISSEKIYRLFTKEQFSSQVRTLLTHLVTYLDVLPQGAPTSPYISNLVMKDFDEEIGTYCEMRKIDYTRYCDDLTFSGNFDCWEVKRKVSALLKRKGFILNEKKTRIIKKNNAQVVTGIVVNEKVNVRKTLQKRLRQELYYIKKYGIESHVKRIGEEKETYKRHLMGQINYCISIHPKKEFIEYKNLLQK